MKNIITDKKVFIIAEAGVNHNGKLGLARKLVDAAKAAGCDAVKFQTFKTEQLVSKKALLAGYQVKKGKSSPRTQFDLIKRLELTFDEVRKVKEYCDRKKIMFLSTPFDTASADHLEKLNMPVFKIPSGEVTNLPFLSYIAGKKRPLILSTGMADLGEVKEAVKIIYQTGNKDLVLLHCVTEYPAPYAEVNLKAMRTLAETFRVPVGFSDHTLGIEVAVAAVALGAQVIEKHLTLDKDLEGPDHRSSLEPQELKLMVESIRHVSLALGDGIKKPSSSERKNIDVVRRSIIAAEDIPAGAAISLENIAVKRPGFGIQPKYFGKIIGARALNRIRKDEVILWDHLAVKNGRSA